MKLINLTSHFRSIVRPGPSLSASECTDEKPVKLSSTDPSPTSIASSQPLLPDIWLEILAYAHWNSIHAVSRTCRFLRLLALPFIFHEVSFQVNPLELHLNHYKIRPKQWVDHNRKRLRFLTSDRVASSIRRVRISDIQVKGNLKLKAVEADSLIAHILSSLPKFGNLKAVEFEDIRWSTALWKNLVVVGNPVWEIVMENCSLEMEEGIQNGGSLQARRLTVTDGLWYPPEQWISVAQQVNHLTFDIDYIHSPSEILTRHPKVIQHLRRAYISPSASCGPFNTGFPNFLDHCTSIEELWFWESSSWNDRATADGMRKVVLPLLREYYGPIDIFCRITSGDTLANMRRLQLEHSGLIPWPSHFLTTVLEQLSGQMTRLESLTIVLQYLTENLLLAVCQFKHLKQLHIKTRNRWRGDENLELDTPGALSLVEYTHFFLRGDLPPTIESLTIESFRPFDHDGDITQAFSRSLRRKLVLRYPNLDDFTLKCGSQYKWIRDHDTPGNDHEWFYCRHAYPICRRDDCQNLLEEEEILAPRDIGEVVKEVRGINQRRLFKLASFIRKI